MHQGSQQQGRAECPHYLIPWNIIPPPIRPSIPASRQQEQQQHRVVHAFKPISLISVPLHPKGSEPGSKRPEPEPTLEAVNIASRDATTQSHLELVLYKACRSMTQKAVQRAGKPFKGRSEAINRETLCHCWGGMLLLRGAWWKTTQTNHLPPISGQCIYLKDKK